MAYLVLILLTLLDQAHTITTSFLFNVSLSLRNILIYILVLYIYILLYIITLYIYSYIYIFAPGFAKPETS
jgi:hypothetical protein